ncbi:hypothetical protein ACIOG4_28740 [Streptomyces microflavus]|uniref:hypothetical protein n=1 Tax=Streptomyces microflavus TaxID=1919 RepID=UPI003816DB16
MNPDQVRNLCVEILREGPDIVSTAGWTDGSRRPSGLLVLFSSGARLWTGITTSDPAGPEARDYAPATPSPLPDLYDDARRITPSRVEGYLAAVLAGARAPQITGAYSYSVTARHPGVGLYLAGGARAFLPFVYAAASGKDPAVRPFTIDSTF